MKKVIQDHEGLCYNRLMKVPRNVKKYFWEIDAKKLNPDKYPEYVIARILEYGDREDVAWMLKHYSRNQIIKILENSRNLSQKSANYWVEYFDLPRRKILCLQKQFRGLSRAIWNY